MSAESSGSNSIEPCVPSPQTASCPPGTSSFVTMAISGPASARIAGRGDASPVAERIASLADPALSSLSTGLSIASRSTCEAVLPWRRAIRSILRIVSSLTRKASRRRVRFNSRPRSLCRVAYRFLPAVNSDRSTASAIALYPASFGCRWSRMLYAGRICFGLAGSFVAASKSMTPS